MGIICNYLKPNYVLFAFIILISILQNYCFCITTQKHNNSSAGSRFSAAVATWYGDPNGAGSVGGACGYGFNVEKRPFSAMIAAGNANLFQSGMGCGACYQVKCRRSENPNCSGKAVTVTITDECGCDGQNVHFDLSGAAFGAMAKPGRAQALRNAGTFKVEYRRVRCNYPRTNLAFDIDKGSNPNYFACVVKYVNGDGDLSAVDLQTRNGNEWLPMQHSWGATWKVDLANGVKAPFSIRITTRRTNKTIVARHVIPADWQPGKSYQSLAN
ncbi:hypothetical protein MIMGU_mgv1a019518mg [Erythranthe guttata]|uniref:Expansin-like EG45 domain-containing protein n=1 Tax=Erythranthe guttata TaxID=4155 RepID=A0A022QZI2_ERYGU|nr:hypothetical protein MIMGU_mgv1a019518mg [Erythranthe guttata]